MYICPKVITAPSQSPDLNAIDNISTKLGTEIRSHSISHKEDPKNILREEWERISPEYTRTQKLVESIPDRLKEITINRGLQTPY